MTDFSNATNLLTADAAYAADRSGAPPVIGRHAAFTRLFNLEQDVKTLKTATQNDVQTLNRLAFAGNVSEGDYVTIDSQKFEFRDEDGAVSNDANIAVQVGSTTDDSIANLVAAVNATTANNEHDNITNNAATAPAKANGTKNVLAVADTTNDYVYFYPATAPGGTKVEGSSPNIAFTKSGSNLTLLRANFNATPAISTFENLMAFKIDVTTALLALTQPLTFALDFEPQGVLIQARNSSGVVVDTLVDASWAELVDGQWELRLNINNTSPSRTKRAEVRANVVANTSQYFHLNLPHGAVATGYKFVRGGTVSAGTLTVALNQITRSTGASAATLSTAVSVASGTNDVEQTFTPSSAVPHTFTSAQGLKGTVAASSDYAGPLSFDFIVDYVEYLANTDDLFVVVYG